MSKKSKKKKQDKKSAKRRKGQRLLPAPVQETAVDVFGMNSMLERCKSLWEHGQWAQMRALDEADIASDRHRDRIAALLAAEASHSGDAVRARRFTRLAREWGCDERILSRLMISAVNNTLGRASVALGDDTVAAQRFEQSIALIEPHSDTATLARVRQIRETADMGLKTLALTMLESTVLAIANDHRSDTLLLPVAQLADLVQTAGHGKSPALPNSGGSAPVVVVAGMRHSGSTALFNTVRLGYVEMGLDPVAGYSEVEGFMDAARGSQGPTIIKTHEMRDDVRALGTVILTTVRDLRDTVASSKRRNFSMLEKTGGVVAYAKYNRMLNELWEPLSDYRFEFERYMRDPVAITREVFALLGIDQKHAERVVEQVSNLPVDQYRTTLLTNTHITDPERVLSYADTLEPESIQRIEHENRAWLLANRYPISTGE